MKVNDLTGKRFGRLVVIDRAPSVKGRAYWVCKCDCGNMHTVMGKHLSSGKVISCGCYHLECITKHGLCGTRIYKEWRNMLGRVRGDNPIYAHVTVCPEWEQFDPFYQWAMSHGYSDDLTLDRIDGTKGYSPDNCRWVDRIVQNNNLKSNHLLTYKGETHTVAEWCRIRGLVYSTVMNRIIRGWPVSMCLSKKRWKNQYE